MTAQPGLAQDALYSCTHMATVGVKGLKQCSIAALSLFWKIVPLSLIPAAACFTGD